MIIMAPRGFAFNAALPLVSVSTGEWLAAPTIAAGDGQVSKDFGTFANLATLPAETPASSKQVKFALSAAEMTADVVMVRMIDQTSPKEWLDTGAVIHTYGPGYIEGTINDAGVTSTGGTLSNDFPATTDALTEAAVVFLTGTHAGLSRKITGYTSGRVATWDALPSAPANGDRIRVIGVVK